MYSCSPVIPAPQEDKTEDHKFKTSLGDLESDPVSKVISRQRQEDQQFKAILATQGVLRWDESYETLSQKGERRKRRGGGRGRDERKPVNQPATTKHGLERWLTSLEHLLLSQRT